MTMGIEQFHQMAEQMRGGKGRAVRYTDEARAWAVEYAEREMATGESVGAVATKLRVSDMTLRSWLYAAAPKPEPELREVVVEEAPQPPAAARALSLTTSSGHTLTGLDIEDASALLRSLR